VISATIGLVLQLLRDSDNILARIISSFIGIAWTLLTFFVIPVMILEKRGVLESVGESAGLFKQTWGETVVGQAGVSLIFVIAALVALVPVILILMTGISVLMIAVISLYLLLLVVLFVIANAMQGVYNTALYLYARNGVVPDAFPKDLIEMAFQPKKGSGNRGGNI
jgi:hypothetical protein